MVISTNIKPLFGNEFDISQINTTTHINLGNFFIFIHKKSDLVSNINEF